ncbi:HWE histidine kinase domain-containing protein [Novosphingobium sp. BL-8A]|uniref:HWE histidine kinase domain-containing protein n=1 Tax=Novosphingobium sp. BL-8A TaxID=3127639 RepID=UPI00375838F7
MELASRCLRWREKADDQFTAIKLEPALHKWRFNHLPSSIAGRCGIGLRRRQLLWVHGLDEEKRRPWIWLAETYGYRECWSLPLTTRSERLVGCVTLYFPERRVPEKADQDLAAMIGQTAAMIISRHHENENRLRSEERFHQFATAASGALWIRDAITLKMEYASSGIERIYGVDKQTFLDRAETWASSIVPEDRAIAFESLHEAQAGKAVVHEFRIRRVNDGAFRWIRNTDFPLCDPQGRVDRIGGIAEDVTDAKLAIEHQENLLAELQHRVRNVMAIIRSIVDRTIGGAASVQEYAELMKGRIDAFSRVQALLTRAANISVDLRSIVHDELNALAIHEKKVDAMGPAVELSPKAAETMALVIHELAANARKYGALAARDGLVRVRWEVFDLGEQPWLAFDWNEDGAPGQTPSAEPHRVGFGRELIEGRIPYELSGRGNVRIDRGGAQCHLEFPLTNRPSVLGTNAPQRASVFGGTIDRGAKRI